MESMVDNRSSYSFKDHYFLFISLVYGLIIFTYFDCWKMEIYNLLKEILIDWKLDKITDFSFENLLPFYLSSFFMFYVLESWWASQIDSRYITRFQNFLLGIGHPILLLFMVFFTCNNDFRYSVNLLKNIVSFNLMIAISLSYVLIVRGNFHGLRNFFSSSNKYRLIGIGAAILTCLLWILWLKCTSTIIQIILAYFNGLLFIAGIIHFIKYKRNPESFLSTVTQDEFLERIIPLAKLTQRNSQSFAVVLIDGKKTSKYKIQNDIVSKFRKEVVSIISHTGIFQLFIPCIQDSNAVKSKLVKIKKEHNNLNIDWEFRQLHNECYTDSERPDKKNEVEDSVKAVYKKLYDRMSEKIHHIPVKSEAIN